MTILEMYPDKFTVDPVTGCWLFAGSITKKGYGQVKYRFNTVLVHRLSAHLSLGLDITDSITQVCHKLECPNKHCANPEHLYLGDNSDNQRDAVTKGTHVTLNKFKTHCKYGHPLSGDNVYIPADGRRRCKICKNEAKKRSNIIHGR